MLELGILAAFAAVLCWGGGDFFIQRATRKIGDVKALFFIGFIGSVLLLPFVAGEFPRLLDPNNLGYLAGIGVLTFAVALLLFEALKQGKLSVIDVLFEIELPVTIILALLFFGETLSVVQLGLVAAVFVGIVLVALERPTIKHLVPTAEKGVLLAVLGAIGMGILNFSTANAARTISPLLAIWVPWAAFTVLCLTVIVERRQVQSLGGDVRKHYATLLGEGVLDTAAWVFFAFALAAENASVVTAITESYPAVALLLGVWINREKIRAHQYAGALIALCAGIALGLFA